jgi:hypothetical protein
MRAPRWPQGKSEISRDFRLPIGRTYREIVAIALGAPNIQVDVVTCFFPSILSLNRERPSRWGEYHEGVESTGG